MASFGVRRQTDCGQKPGGFTRLTPEVLNWVKTVTIYHPGISDPGEMLIVQHHFLLLTTHVILAVLITGGEGALQSAEIYHPDHDTPFVLPDLPDDRLSQTQDGSLLCGGRWTPRSCQRWDADTGIWVLVTDSLIEDRRYHISWTPRESSDTYLIGGYKSGNTSEAIALDFDNGVTSSFLLQHRTEYD